MELLSRRSRRETVERCAETSPKHQDTAPEYETGAPRLRDYPGLVMGNRVQLDLSRPLQSSLRSVGRALVERLPLIGGDVRARVARLEGRLRASAEFQIVNPDGRWHLEVLTTREIGDGVAIDAVLRCGVRDAGSTGARRVFARLPSDPVVDAALRRSGFVPYTSEEVFIWKAGTAKRRVEAPSAVRRVHPADVWGIHQLYLDTEPRQVQYADAITSSVWEDSAPLKLQSRRSSGWVFEDHGRIRGYARLSTREDPRVIRIDLMVEPTKRSLASDLVAGALHEAQRLPSLPSVAVVPTYRRELRSVLLEAGFESLGEQTSWVCYTTVPARAQIVAVDLRKPAVEESQRARVPGLGGAGMNSIQCASAEAAAAEIGKANPHS